MLLLHDKTKGEISMVAPMQRYKETTVQNTLNLDMITTNKSRKCFCSRAWTISKQAACPMGCAGDGVWSLFLVLKVWKKFHK